MDLILCLQHYDVVVVRTIDHNSRLLAASPTKAPRKLRQNNSYRHSMDVAKRSTWNKRHMALFSSRKCSAFAHLAQTSLDSNDVKSVEH